MVEIVYLALVCAVAAVCYLVIAQRNRQAMAFWLAALAASTGAGACRFMFGDLTGAEELGIPLDDHIAFVIEAMRGISDDLGL